MYTDRFLKLPIKIYDKTLADLMGKEGDTRDIISRVDPADICEYHESEDEGQEVTQVYFKTGRSFAV